jgi:putative endonuclease
LKHVYLLQSLSHPSQRYIGITGRLKQRLQEHNNGRSPHTAKFIPWEVITVVSFNDNHTAVEFEQYLKSGSGKAFAQRHLWKHD